MSFDARNLRNLGNRIEVQIPRDEAGYIGRECPNSDCLGYFKVMPGTGLPGSGIPCHCPYCGHTGSHNTFWTPEQVEYAKSIALGKVTDAIRKDLKQLEFEHKPKGPFGIGFSMKLEPGASIPIKRYREKELETHVTCGNCTLEYAVYGVFAYCPDCGVHNSLQILERSLTVIEKQVTLATSITDLDLKNSLIEDALENCVSSFDGFGREECRVAFSKIGTQVKNYSFQNLELADERLQKDFGVSLKSNVDPHIWSVAVLGFMRRHVIAHRAGVVDQKYIDQTSDPTAHVGRRLHVDPDHVRDVAVAVREIGQRLTDLLR
jgi:hypothetical protein